MRACTLRVAATLCDAFGFVCACERCESSSRPEPPIDVAHFNCLKCGAELAPADAVGGASAIADGCADEGRGCRCSACGELMRDVDLRRCAAEAAEVVDAALVVAQRSDVLAGAAAVSDALRSSAASRLRVAHPVLFDAYLYLAAVCCQPEGKAQLSPAQRARLLADVVAACRHRCAGAHVRLAELVTSMSAALELSGDIAEAASAMAEAHALYCTVLGPDHEMSAAVGAKQKQLEARASAGSVDVKLS